MTGESAPWQMPARMTFRRPRMHDTSRVGAAKTRCLEPAYQPPRATFGLVARSLICMMDAVSNVPIWGENDLAHRFCAVHSHQTIFGTESSGGLASTSQRLMARTVSAFPIARQSYAKIGTASWDLPRRSLPFYGLMIWGMTKVMDRQ
jgi:hypothetical protein